MKRQIRRSVFETNSSSTHSIIICCRKNKVYNDIPKNSTVVIDGTYNTESIIFDEMGKLNFVVTMLASIVECKNDYDELNIKSFDEMINLNWFRWLKEVVYDQSGTDLVYECPIGYQNKPVTYVPYYDTTYDEDDTVEDIFTGGHDNIIENEELFKKRVKDIIYNPEVLIKDEEEEY